MINNKGITLLMLVITIVVICILVGITVQQIVSENGIFQSITNIGEKSKSELNNAVNTTENEIKDKLDNAEGARNTAEKDDVLLECIDKWSKHITVKLNIGSYNFKDGEYGIDNIKYGMKKEGAAAYDTSKLKNGTESKYICKFENLDKGMRYRIGAFAEYKDRNGDEKTELIAETEEAIETYSWNFDVGDWVDYDAGAWTQAEIDNLGSTYYKDTEEHCQTIKNNITNVPMNYNSEGKIFNTNRNKFSGMSVGTDKNSTQKATKTSYWGTFVHELGSNSWKQADKTVSLVENTTALANYTDEIKGWRILHISDKGYIEIVSTGIPEYFIGRCLYMKERHDHFGGLYGRSNECYVESDIIKTLKERNFSEYVNSTYAIGARLMDYNDAISAKTAKQVNLFSIGSTYILGTVRNIDKYITFEEAWKKKIYGESNLYTQVLMANNNGVLHLPKITYKSDRTGDSYCIYSAGVLGVRVVVTLNPEYIPNETKEGETEKRTGKSYSDRLYLVKKSEVKDV